jgi:hypothetical protein
MRDETGDGFSMKLMKSENKITIQLRVKGTYFIETTGEISPE